MSRQNVHEPDSIPAAVDLSAVPFTFIDINTSGQAIACAAGGIPLGLLDNNPKAGEQARYYSRGIRLKVKVGTGGITAGDKISVGAGGTAVLSVTSGHALVGRALETKAAAKFAEIQFSPGLGSVA